MAAVSLPTATIARGAQLIGFAVVAVALAIVSWQDSSLSLPSVGQFAGIIGSGFLGGIINPLMKSLAGTDSVGTAQSADTAAATAQMTQTVEAAQDKAAMALGSKTDRMWDVAVVIGAAAIVVAALALAVDGSHHVNAAAALTALATAFGALFVDTTKITHSVGAGAGAVRSGN